MEDTNAKEHMINNEVYNSGISDQLINMVHTINNKIYT